MSDSSNNQHVRTLLLGTEIVFRILVVVLCAAVLALSPFIVIFVGPPLAAAWHFFRVFNTINDISRPKGKKLKQGILYIFVLAEVTCLASLIATAAITGNSNSRSDTNRTSDSNGGLDPPKEQPYTAVPRLTAAATAFQAILFLGACCLASEGGYLQTVMYLPHVQKTSPNPHTRPRDLKPTTTVAAGAEEIAFK